MLAPIVGGAALRERTKSAEAMAKLEAVAGFTLTGFGLGEPPAQRVELLAACIKPLPTGKIRCARQPRFLTLLLSTVRCALRIENAHAGLSPDTHCQPRSGSVYRVVTLKRPYLQALGAWLFASGRFAPWRVEWRRHVMGLGMPEEVLLAVEHGVDLLDSIYPYTLTVNGFGMTFDPDVLRDGFDTAAVPPGVKLNLRSLSCM